MCIDIELHGILWISEAPGRERGVKPNDYLRRRRDEKDNRESRKNLGIWRFPIGEKKKP